MSANRQQPAAETLDLSAGSLAELFPDVDGRKRQIRDLRVRLAALISDHGGVSEMTYARMSLAKRAIFVEEAIEQVERRIAQGEDIPADELGRWVQQVNGLHGLYKTLGLERRQRRIPGHDRLAELLAD